MCVAVPMRVVAIDAASRTATVELHGNRLSVDVSLVDADIGDQVLVHAGCALEIVSRELAAEILELFRELEELAGNGS